MRIMSMRSMRRRSRSMMCMRSSMMMCRMAGLLPMMTVMVMVQQL